ncbi:hypothetical protein DFH07DRAFT_763952 [Mycena maculata]|uniref:Uncharacterized protein n=1 Tax=Mycena maculata TaxID=230809 RepID=A0AAD7KH15_9AGAR|nr:hypothetical protein DFH07DRAFT_763952 [Mycena maculata]
MSVTGPVVRLRADPRRMGSSDGRVQAFQPPHIDRSVSIVAFASSRCPVLINGGPDSADPDASTCIYDRDFGIPTVFAVSLTISLNDDRLRSNSARSSSKEADDQPANVIPVVSDVLLPVLLPTAPGLHCPRVFQRDVMQSGLLQDLVTLKAMNGRNSIDCPHCMRNQAREMGLFLYMSKATVNPLRVVLFNEWSRVAGNPTRRCSTIDRAETYESSPTGPGMPTECSFVEPPEVVSFNSWQTSQSYQTEEFRRNIISKSGLILTVAKEETAWEAGMTFSRRVAVALNPQ